MQAPPIGNTNNSSKLVDAVTMALKSMDATGKEPYPAIAFSGMEEDAAQEDPRPRSGDHLKRKGGADFSRAGSFAATDDALHFSTGAGSVEAAALDSVVPQGHSQEAPAAGMEHKTKRVCKGEASGMPPRPPMARSDSVTSSKADLSHYAHPSSGMTAPPVQRMVVGRTTGLATRGGAGAEGSGLSRFHPTGAYVANSMRRNDSLVSEASVQGTCTAALACTESAFLAESPSMGAALMEEEEEEAEIPAMEALPLSPVYASEDDESEDFLSCFGEESESPRSMVDATHTSFRSAGDKQAADLARRYAPLLTAMLPGSRPIPHEVIAFDLAIANRAIAGEPLPDGVTFIPVDPRCCMLPMAAQCGIPPIAVVLGASYLQRLMATRPEMREVADAAGWFLSGQDNDGGAETMRSAPFDRSTLGLLTIYVACIYLAAKLSDRVQYRNLMSTMLSGLLGQQVPGGEATALEGQVLEKLQWRLGPFYL